MVDDTYTKMQFLVEEPKVSINPIGEQAVGSKFEITGTTKLMYDDNDLLDRGHFILIQADRQVTRVVRSTEQRESTR